MTADDIHCLNTPSAASCGRLGGSLLTTHLHLIHHNKILVKCDRLATVIIDIDMTQPSTSQPESAADTSSAHDGTHDTHHSTQLYDDKYRLHSNTFYYSP